MTLTDTEKSKIQIFQGLSLNKNQLETIIGRPLADREWRAHNRDYKTIFSQVARHAANVAVRKLKPVRAKPSNEDIELLRVEKQRIKYIPYIEDHKRTFKSIALEASKKLR